ncbi:MAG: HAD hydrolase-like protein [Wenzhouxiangellaceae bacterium]|nr:HAD hydrolase-like protein [Wenzhouxiangellaceae bacterium]
MSRARLQAVLFDLDGTLADTAPDLIGALARLRIELGLPATDSGPLRALVGRGAVAILEAGLPELGRSDREAFRERFLDDYRVNCWVESRPFEGMPECLEKIESLGLAWGVVTNKIARLAGPVLEHAGWSRRAGCLIAGDTTARPKPAADPVLAACAALGVAPANVLFVGDDHRDVLAGRAAGCITAAALWGYIPSAEDSHAWQADLMLESPVKLGEAIADWQLQAIA